MELNYFGAFKIVHTIGQRLASRGRGRICLVGSVCSFASFPGYAGYASSKFALRALSDAMNHEFGAKGVKCHLFLPGSMDSPGFEEENRTKPDVCKRIEGNGKLLTPDEAARVCIKGMSAGHYYITTETLFDILLVATSGSIPRANPIFDFIMAVPSVLANFAFDLVVRYETRKTKKASE